MSDRMSGILDFLNGTFLDPRSEEEKENARIGKSYSQGEGAQFYPPENYLDPYQTFSNVNTSPVMATQPVVDKQVVQQPVPQQMSNNTQGSMNAMDMMGMFPQNMATSAVDQAWESQRPQEPVEEPSFMEKAGSGISDWFSNKENIANLAIGLNSMRLNPDPNLAALMGKNLESMRKSKGRNATVTKLREKGRNDLADAVESGAMKATDAWTLAFKAPSAFQEKLDFIKGMTPEEVKKYTDLGILGGGTTINMGEKTNMEFTQAAIKDAQAQITGGYSADNSLRDIAILRKLGSNPVLQEVPDMARGLIPTGWSPAMDAYNGQLNKVAKGLRQAGEGVMTEKDFEVLQETSGAASMNIQARQILQSSLEETAKRQIERSSIASQFMSQNITLSEYYAKMGELKNRPMFTTEQTEFLNSLEGVMGYSALNKAEKESVPQETWKKMTTQQKEAFIRARSN